MLRARASNGTLCANNPPRGPLLIVLAAQTVLVAACATWVTFPFVGRDYESAIIAGAFCGFAMGATATAIANMQALRKL